jgi:geranylgeranyl pyrophosphate synthase
LRIGVDEALAHILAEIDAPAIVVEPMRYALLGGGKRLRPCLSLAAADAIASRVRLTEEAARARALPGACAVELVHAYSLVHDDLPAMDNDTLRRGRPTTHVVFGEGMAILAGDALLTEAFATLARSAAMAEQSTRALALLAAAAGAHGMVGGQAIDLAAAGRVPGQTAALDRTRLDDMHARKTGALIRAAVTIGAVLLDADRETIAALDRYAREVGLAFQIVDDILDVEGSAEEIGKTAGKDAASGKPTYPMLVGLDESRRMADDCCARAKHALAGAGITGRLGEIADWTVRRKK